MGQSLFAMLVKPSGFDDLENFRLLTKKDFGVFREATGHSGSLEIWIVSGGQHHKCYKITSHDRPPPSAVSRECVGPFIGLLFAAKHEGINCGLLMQMKRVACRHNCTDLHTIFSRVMKTI